MRVLLVVNPVSSSMTERRRSMVEARLAARFDVEATRTKTRGHARELAAAAAAEGVDVVVVASGDGTLNEAADGLVGSNTALAALPGGSTNVFARAVGYGNRMDRALERLVAALERGSVRRIGVGVANGRHFLFHLGAGFDAAVVERIEQRPGVKRFAAHPAFAVQTMRLLARGYDRREPSVHVEVPSGGPNHNSFFTVVSNLAPYTFVGPRRMLLSTAATLDRPLAVTSLTRFTVRDVAAAFGSAVGRSARLQHATEVVQLADVDALRLTACHPDRRFPWQVDGEPMPAAEALDVRYVPDALSVVLPGGRPSA